MATPALDAISSERRDGARNEEVFSLYELSMIEFLRRVGVLTMKGPKQEVQAASFYQ